MYEAEHSEDGMLIARQATVIIVDDDAQLRDSLGLLLRSADYRDVGYASAEDYLAHGPPDRPGCLLIDLHLPGMSGIELQQQISGQRPRLPIVFLSGDARRADIDRAIAAGALDFLRKPFDPEMLLARVRDGLNESLHAAGRGLRPAH